MKLKDYYKAAKVGSAVGVGAILLEAIIVAVTGDSRIGRASRNLFPMTCYITGVALGSGLGMSVADLQCLKGDDELE